MITKQDMENQLARVEMAAQVTLPGPMAKEIFELALWAIENTPRVRLVENEALLSRIEKTLEHKP